MSTSSVTLRTAKQIHQGAQSVSMHINTWNEIVNEHLALEQKLASLQQQVAFAKLRATENSVCEQKLAVAVECLKFYGDKAQMNHGITFGDDETGFVNEDDFESIFNFDKWSEHDYYVYGKRAREALDLINPTPKKAGET